MPYSSGTFSRVHDFTDDRDNGIRIQASRMDAEMDGIATGLSTALLKDGTQTATAKIPFAVGLSVIDNQTILLGTNSDIAIQYDETTNDSLEISANVEGAALGIVLKSDQGDDNADQHKLSIADGGTLTLGSKISGSFVTYLTHTPNATVASSTLAVAGNLTVGGNLTLGSGAELSEAELEMLDGITAGTVAASKAVVVDANKDIASFRNITLTGELDAGSLDVSGNVDIDGTLETDALSIASTAVTATAAELNYNDTGAAVGTVVASKTVTVDANKDVSSFRNITLTGELDAGSLDVSGDADIDGTLEADAMTLNGTAITTVATLSTGISNGNLPVFTSGVADDDFLRVNGTSIEGRSASEVLSDIGASAVAGSSSIVTTGALNAGSITSGFGTIDTGSSTITTTGVGTFGSLDISGDIDVDGTTNLDVVDIDGAVDMASTLIVNDSVTFQSSGSSKPVLTLKNTNADTTPPSITFQKDSSSPADNDEVANINFYGDDDGGSVAAYANLKVVSTDVSNGSEDGKMTIKTMVGGTLRNKLDITSSEVVINEDSIDSDFRVESDNNTHALFVQGSDGNVGIGTSSPSYGISVQSATDTSASGSFKRTSGSEIRILPQGVQANIGTYTNHPLVFNTNSTERMRIDSAGHVTMPYQPSFLARPSSRQSNLAINTTHTIAFGTEVFDRGADFASSTFTAPIEGLYQLNVQLLIQQMDSATDYYYINLKTSNRNYDQYWDNDDKAGDNSNGAGVSIVVLADMDAGDTAFVQIIVPNSGSAQMDVETASAFSGFLAC
jgi:hypothetical protein